MFSPATYSSIVHTDMPVGEELSTPRKGVRGIREPASVDCFTYSISRVVSLEAFVAAFYTNPFFRIELIILGLFGYPSKPQDVPALFAGQRQDYAAWTLEYRDDRQIVMADKLGATKHFLMVNVIDETNTQLHFGSAVMPRINKDGSERPPSFYFKLLEGFHVFYSKALLTAAVVRLKSLS